ncbi:MAG: FKBP-type peptidyl-prolyl cis-trans isomerase [Candidatus Omnitrophota bacterium]|nr:FKBP-type peptidyl-prolyl cis-trans isomerase [Candidatus Omnitrophota bacterium]
MKKILCAAVCFLALFAGTGISNAEKNESLDLSVSDNRIVSIDYTLYADGNTIVETTKGKKPLIYVQGKGQLLNALEKELAGMRKGQKKNIVIKPEDGYGEIRKDYFVEVPIEEVPEASRAEGKVLTVTGKDGGPVNCVVKKIDATKAVLDFNHSLAGKILRYKVEVIDVKDRMQFN